MNCVFQFVEWHAKGDQGATMTKDQIDELQTIVDNLNINREALLRFCFRADAEDIEDVGDGLPGSILDTLVRVGECMGDVNAAMKELPNKVVYMSRGQRAKSLSRDILDP